MAKGHAGYPSTRTDKATRLLLSKASSVAILHEPLFSPGPGQRASSNGSVEMADPCKKPTVEGSPQAIIAVDISLRRGRITLLTTVMVGMIVAAVRFFQNDYEIRLFDKTELDSATRKKVLDKYNSYSGTFASIFGKPIELFVTACVQVIMLRFVSISMLQSEPSWKAVYSSAGVGYLINNRFNSLNVQLVDKPIHLVMVASDFTRNDTAPWAPSGAAWTNVSHSVPENQPFNPIANTILRSLVQSRAVRAKSMCDSLDPEVDGIHEDAYEQQSGQVLLNKPVAIDTIEYGFPQHDWMKQLLPEALPERSLSMLLNPTDDLPINASIASNLVLHAMILSTDFIPLKGSLRDPAAYNNNVVWDGLKLTSKSVAVRAGILPPDLSPSDAVQKKWFLETVNAFLATAFNGTKNMTLTNIPMRFSHVDIAANIIFDAVTLEIDVDPKLLAEFTDTKTGARCMNGESALGINDRSHGFTCDLWPARCLFKKRDPNIPSSALDTSDLYYDAPAQIQAFSICLNDEGTELLQRGSEIEYPTYLSIKPCARTSTTSMLVLSVGKRILADELTMNMSANATGIRPGGNGTAINLRKIYSFTVGRLARRTTDIAEEFGAASNVPRGIGNCQGARAPTQSKQHASHISTTCGQFGCPSNGSTGAAQAQQYQSEDAKRQRPLTLVQVNEPTRQINPEHWYDVAAGDVLLLTMFAISRGTRHGTTLATYVWSQKNASNACCNDMYIEHPLKATYTAAVFFLFQNGVVKDTVPANTTSVSLAFNWNTQKVALSVLSPSTNSILTQLGCFVPAIGVAVSLLWATIIRNSIHRPNHLTGIANAEVMARAKLDEQSFPPLLLHRQVTLTSGTGTESRDLDEFVVSSLSLQQRATNDDVDDARLSVTV